MADARTRRATEFGVDCTDELVWAGGSWTAGGEYPKRIILKNVSRDILTLRYKLPTSRFFVMDFPEPVKLRCVTSLLHVLPCRVHIHPCAAPTSCTATE
jgi:hypothetical protein